MACESISSTLHPEQGELGRELALASVDWSPFDGPEDLGTIFRRPDQLIMHFAAVFLRD
jgi:hypothetical protein